MQNQNLVKQTNKAPFSGKEIALLLVTFISILLVNLLISYIVRRNNISFVANISPIGYVFGYYSSALILFIVTVILFQCSVIKMSPINSVLILSGVYSNFVEKVVFSNVADFLSISRLNFNLADIQIFIGLILLNYKIFFDFKIGKIINPQQSPHAQD